MTFQEALHFLSATQIDATQPSTWADLGCGSGLFTKAVSARLHSNSTIYAIDKSSQTNIISANDEVKIIFRKANFIKDELPLSSLHGILMANSLHYVKDKKTLLYKLKTYLLPGAVFIIIEYDKARSNLWVPYPVSFNQLIDLFREAGYQNVEKTGERKSLYQSGKMYVSLIQPV